MTRVTLTTANTPGAVAIVQLHGDRVGDTLQRLTGRARFASRHAYLCELADVDQGLAIQFSETAAQLMPHGGPRVVARLLDHLTLRLGCTYDPNPNPQTLYPEAASPIEADTLDAIAKATSPAAIDLLAQQTTRWATLLQQKGERAQHQRQAIARRSQTLDQLLTPPTVALVGPANVGKSTLTNALMGKRMSIVADLPGTTRDWVGGLVELASKSPQSGQDQRANDADAASSQRPVPNAPIAVQFLDTPGLRDSDDAVEQRAIQLAQKQLEQASVLIAVRDSDHPWPSRAALPREPDLYVMNKVDDAGTQQSATAGSHPDQPLDISAMRERNLDRFQHAVIDCLGLSDIDPAAPWAFSQTLRDWCTRDDHALLRDYIAKH